MSREAFRKTFITASGVCERARVWQIYELYSSYQRTHVATRLKQQKETFFFEEQKKKAVCRGHHRVGHSTILINAH